MGCFYFFCCDLLRGCLHGVFGHMITGFCEVGSGSEHWVSYDMHMVFTAKKY